MVPLHVCLQKIFIPYFLENIFYVSVIRFIQTGLILLL